MKPTSDDHAERREPCATKAYSEKIVACMASSVVVLRADLVIVLVNQAFQDVFGIDGQDAIGRPVTEVLPAEGLRQHALGVLRDGESRPPRPFEIHLDGAARSLLITLAHVEHEEGAGQEAPRLLLVVEDITERRRFRAEAQAHEGRFRSVFHNATDGIVMSTGEGAITYFNPAAERIFGYSSEDALGRSVEMLLPQGCSMGSPGTTQEKEGVHRNGTVIPLECSISEVQLEGSAVFTAVVRDVSERRRAEEALRRSEASFRTLSEQSPDAISVDRNERFVYVNANLVKMLGYAQCSDLVGQPLSTVVHPEDWGIVQERRRALSETGEPTPPRVLRLLRQDGSTVRAEVAFALVEHEGELAFVAVVRDVTAREELARRIEQMDRIISLGTLAAGVGHEINNPLTYVNANIAMAMARVGDLRSFAESVSLQLRERIGDEAASEMLATAEEARFMTDLCEIEQMLGQASEGGDRIRDAVDDLRTYARVDDEARVALDINEIVRSAVEMTLQETRQRAQLVVELGEPGQVLGEEHRLVRVVVNLLMNAAQAIEVAAKRHHVIRVCTYVCEGEVIVEVRDTGTGVRPEDLGRLFDPFFTTKVVGQGTGLGLFICSQTVESHGGRLLVESRRGEGSVFRMVLPLAPPTEPTASTLEESPVVAARRGRIMVIDDEPTLGLLIRNVLGRDHEVLAFTEARAALRALKSGEQIDLILCDLMMPDMTGMDFFEALRTRHAEHAERMVFLTGGAFTAPARDFLERIPNTVVRKPFDPHELRALVRERISA